MYGTIINTVKILDKRHIIREKKVQYVSREKEILTLIDHPFFVKLYFTFQDKDNLCILHPSLLSVLLFLSLTPSLPFKDRSYPQVSLSPSLTFSLPLPVPLPLHLPPSL